MSKKVNKDKVNDLVVKNESNYQIPKRILLQQEKQRKAYEEWLNSFDKKPIEAIPEEKEKKNKKKNKKVKKEKKPSPVLKPKKTKEDKKPLPIFKPKKTKEDKLKDNFMYIPYDKVLKGETKCDSEDNEKYLFEPFKGPSLFKEEVKKPEKPTKPAKVSKPVEPVKEKPVKAKAADKKPEVKEVKPAKPKKLKETKEKKLKSKFLYIPYIKLVKGEEVKQFSDDNKFLYEPFKGPSLYDESANKVEPLPKEIFLDDSFKDDEVPLSEEKPTKDKKYKLEETKEDYPKSKYLYIPYDRLLKGKKIREIKGIKKFLYDPFDDSYDDLYWENDKDDFFEDDDTDIFEDKKSDKPVSDYRPTPNVINSYDPADIDVLLDVCNLTKQYNRKAKPAIDQISFQVRRGEFHAFVGANGAGKTTTIKSIVGAYASFDGKIKIGGVNNKSKYSKIKLGYIPELARFPSRISAYNYLVDMAMLNRLTKEEAVKFVDDILKTFNMENLKKVSPNKFSSGQKKKILLAQALSNNPDLLIMDEPTANLDPKSRIEFFDILKKLQLQGKSIFISSHILSELDIYADAITILDGGKIAFSGKRELALEDKKDTYRIVLKEEGDFGKANLSNLNIVQDLENKKEYLVSSSNQELLNNFIFNLFKEKKLVKSEEYKLSIEEMYKKYVIKGSVHTSN